MTSTKLYTSRYSLLNSFVDNTKIVYLIYNTRTNTLLRTTKKLYTLLKKHEIDLSNDKYLNDDDIIFFKKAKIIVEQDEDDDYVRECIHHTILGGFHNTHMPLTIAPTSMCNFRCPYCYEKDKPNITMTNEVISNLINFINSHKLIKDLSITWYGGEPLMAFNQIKEITSRIKKECFAKLTGQSITTNGYNLNQEIIEYFKHENLSSIQITIDGPESVHDKTRILKNGKGTYKRVLANVKRVLKELPHTNISIRVNIGQNNTNTFSETYATLRKELGDKVSIYPGFIHVENKHETCLVCDSMRKSDIMHFYDKVNREGVVPLKFTPTLAKTKGCVASVNGAYVIGPKGEYYKCWNDMGNKDKIIGYIDKSEFKNLSLYTKYVIGSQWFLDPKCLKCSLMPLCNPCAWFTVRNKFHNGTFNNCYPLKDDTLLSKYLITMYKQSLAKNETL